MSISTSRLLSTEDYTACRDEKQPESITHNRGTLEIFMNHFNNAAGKLLPWAITQRWSFTVHFSRHEIMILSQYSPYSQFCDMGVTIISLQVADSTDGGHSQDSFRVQKNKFGTSTQWPIFVQASHLTRSPRAEICTLPSYEGTL